MRETEAMMFVLVLKIRFISIFNSLQLLYYHRVLKRCVRFWNRTVVLFSKRSLLTLAMFTEILVAPSRLIIYLYFYWICGLHRV